MKLKDAELLDDAVFDLLTDAADRAGKSFVEFISETKDIDVNDIADNEYAQQQIDDNRTGG